MIFSFLDRLGDRECLSPFPGETVSELLTRYGIPPASVIVLKNRLPVSDHHVIDTNATYEATLIEGYDINAIRHALRSTRPSPSSDAVVYQKARLIWGNEGRLEHEADEFPLDRLADHVETTVLDTCTRFSLVREGDNILLGLSGGVDSSSLLLALIAVRNRLPESRLVAATFEDYDADKSPTFRHAADIARENHIEHLVIPAELVQQVFHLTIPLSDVLVRLMDTPYAHFAMYVDHHTTRRALEVFAIQNGLNTIALGLHCTDLLGGILNSWTTGYHTANIPLREIGGLRYIYPLGFIAKRELHLYHFYRTGRLARHTKPNPWEVHPQDRNFYYYLADQLQFLWPGIELMLFSPHASNGRHRRRLSYTICANCGASILNQPIAPIEQPDCDVCSVLKQLGFIGRPTATGIQ